MSPRVQRKRQAKQSEILDKAMVIIAADGLDSVTIARLARAMDLTVGALYRYFPSKTAILTAVTVRTLQAFTLKLEEAAGLPGDGCERLLNIASAHIDFCRHQPAYAQLINQMMTSPKIQLPPEEREQAMEPAFHLIAFLEHHLLAAQQENLLILNDPRAHALIFWSSIQGAIQLEKLGRLNPTQMYRDALPRRVAADLLKAWSSSHA
jgi:AcrR family transcriptional regulator